jgi:hypothetical protein
MDTHVIDNEVILLSECYDGYSQYIIILTRKSQSLGCDIYESVIT